MLVVSLLSLIVAGLIVRPLRRLRDAARRIAAGEVVDTFSYTISTALTVLNGETGWGGAWYGDTTLFTNDNGSFASQTNYPAPSGNKLCGFHRINP